MKRILGRTLRAARPDLEAVEAAVRVAALAAGATGKDLEVWAKRERDVLRRQEPPDCPLRTIPTFYIELDGTGVPLVPAELVGRNWTKTRTPCAMLSTALRGSSSVPASSRPDAAPSSANA